MRYEVTMQAGVTQYEDREQMVWTLARMFRDAEKIQGLGIGKVLEHDGGGLVSLSLGGTIDFLRVATKGAPIQKRALQQLIHDILERKEELAPAIKITEPAPAPAQEMPESPALATEPAKGPDTQAPSPEAKEGVPPAPEKAVPNPEEVVLKLLTTLEAMQARDKFHSLTGIWEYLAANHPAYWTKARVGSLLEGMIISGAVRRDIAQRYYATSKIPEPVLA